MGSVALCMIVKNEEHYLRECFLSVKGVVDEIIVVDTGSTDNTKKIAREFDAEIYDFEWVNDFSAARNYALSKVKSDWVLYLDADERLAPKSAETIKRLSEEKGMRAYYCNVVSPSNATGTPSVMKFLRFFKYNPEIKFTGRVHEQIEPSLRALGYELLDSEIVINHVGYDVSLKVLQQKAERNLSLLLADYETNPSAYNAFQIGQTYLMMNEKEEARKYFLLVLENPALDKFHIAQTYRYLAAYEYERGNFEKADEYVLHGLARSPYSPLLHVLAANIYLELGDYAASAQHARDAYRYNRELLEGKRTSDFDVLVNEKNMVLYGINLAIMLSDKELFLFFYPETLKFATDENDKRFIAVFHSLFTEGKLPDEFFLYFDAFKNKINDRTFANALYAYFNGPTETAEKTARLFSDSFYVQFALGEKFSKTDKKFAERCFERALELNPADMRTITKLIVIYGASRNVEKLQRIYEIMKTYYPDNRDLLEIVERTIAKARAKA